MSLLRERLKVDCPELWHALEHSWEVATTRWLPRVDSASSSESFNSYPHIKNLETHLDRIVVAYEQYQTATRESAVTFAFSPVETYVICAAILFHDMGRMKESDDHGRNTKEILLGEGRYAELGIPSIELAEPVADICEFHTARPLNSTRLLSTAVHPYGIVRTHELAALLLLVDEMDDTFNRTLLSCLEVQSDTKAQFRRVIREVYLDPRRQTIFTVLDSRNDHLFEVHKKVLRDKAACLQSIRDDLARVGVCINGWCLEYDEHLYDENGKETHEACFYPGYLDEVISQMWDLSTQIIGKASFTYENLAAAMREKDIEKMRIAVRRLAIMARSHGAKDEFDVGIWAGTDHWKWLMRRDSDTHCVFVSPLEILGKQQSLAQSKACPTLENKRATR